MSKQVKKEATKILDAYFSGALPTALEEDIRSWLFYEGSSEEKEQRLEELWKEWVRFEQVPQNEAGVLKSLADLKRRLNLPRVEMQPKKSALPGKLRLGRRIGRIAAVLIPLLVLGGGILLLQRPDDAGQSIAWAEVIEVVTGSTPQEIAMAEGSRIWAKAGTEVSYPETNTGDRIVNLKGEAYFKVARDEQRPFVVRTEKVDVQVLGTEFFVRAMERSGSTEVVLYSGCVAAKIGEKEYTMNEREQLIYDHANNTVTLRSLAAGELINHMPASFECQPLEAVFQTIEERFRVEVTGQRDRIGSEPVTIHLTGEETLDKILFRLRNITGGFAYEIKENQVIIQVQ